MNIDKKFLAANNREKIASLVREFKYVYTDVDGTLVGQGGSIFHDIDGGLSLVGAKAVYKCHSAGVDIVMVSGRNRKQLNADGRMLGFRNFIAELGTQICYDLGGRVVLNTGAAKVSKQGLLKDVKDSGAVELLFKRYKGQLEHHTPWSNERECTFVFRGHIDILDANAFLDAQGYKDLVIIDNGVLYGAEYEGLPELTELHAYHLIPKGIGKASGVRKDKEVRKIRKNTTIAIGDALSDLSIAAEVGALFLVSNAVTDMHDWNCILATHKNVFVCKRPAFYGWSEAVNYFL